MDLEFTGALVAITRSTLHCRALRAGLVCHSVAGGGDALSISRPPLAALVTAARCGPSVNKLPPAIRSGVTRFACENTHVYTGLQSGATELAAI